MTAEPGSREWLDREYGVRAGIPDHEEIFARWARDSAALRERARWTGPVHYGAHPLQTYDVYRPDGDGPDSDDSAPVLVFVHGGYWQSLDQSQFGFLAEPFTHHGVLVVTLNYRLAPEASIGEIVGDVRDGVADVARRAPEFGGDPARIVVSGHSAGGHLVGTLLAEDWTRHGLPADLIRGGCAISGLYDLEPIRRTYLNDALGMTPEQAAEFSPIRARPRTRGPLVLTYGGDESSEFARQQAEFARAWAGQGVEVREVPMADGHHFDAVERLATPGDLHDAVLRLIDDM